MNFQNSSNIPLEKLICGQMDKTNLFLFLNNQNEALLRKRYVETVPKLSFVRAYVDEEKAFRTYEQTIQAGYW